LSLFRRKEPLHVKLAREGEMSLSGQVQPAAQPPNWDVVGIHGLQRPREWDAVATADAADLTGERVEFVALPPDRLVVPENEKVEPLAAALDKELARPYRAEGVRREGTFWAAAARKIETITLPGVDGDEIELTVNDGERTLVVDGATVFGTIPQLERDQHAVRARRLVDDVWEVEFHPL
jgi:hypothetical protein